MQLNPEGIETVKKKLNFTETVIPSKNKEK